jgi:metal-responsive CopG/Arc/MetJ family transcriptional regulator
MNLRQLPAEMIDARDKRAAAEGINRSELLRRLLEAGLKRRSKA